MIELNCPFEQYRGFRYRLNEVTESTESRLARGDYQNKVVGYTVALYRQSAPGRWLKLLGESDEYPTKQIAEEVAETAIDAILDSL